MSFLTKYNIITALFKVKYLTIICAHITGFLSFSTIYLSLFGTSPLLNISMISSAVISTSSSPFFAVSIE
jgi:hypothetical protein